MSKVVQVRDVPDEVHAALARMAESRGQSLSRFVLGEFEQIARRGRNAEIFARARAEPGPRLDPDDIVRMIREERDRDDDG